MILTLLVVVAGQLEVPASWTCEPVRFADGLCDCGCTAVDDDCSADIACARDNCPDGTSLDVDHDHVCLDDDDDDDDDADEDEDEGCGGAGGVAAVVVVPLVRLRRRRRR